MSTILKIVLALVAVLGIGIAYYAFSPIFKHTRIDEMAPPAKEESMSDRNMTGDSMLQDTSEKDMSSMEVGEEAMTKEPTAAPVMGTVGHPAEGTVRIVKALDGTYVRYENFKTLNGPDLYVYLSRDLEAKDFVDLGVLRATEGNINYAVPAGVDASTYRYALVWCKQFGILFNYADLTQKQ